MGPTTTCPACRGSRLRVCPHCHGQCSYSEEEFRVSYGHGPTLFSDKDVRTGRYNCLTCLGHGSVPCPICHGVGYLQPKGER
jgi:hypothetical protein